ncbi:hypothetical protein SAMN02745174_01271 [Cetobacterium ceti]|uniref:Membrane protein involved in the export of O-antigen and teichoic acid n=1 Tax=Cetobacterium ceti TaxID=180163 RepID=A0A1T4MQC1_9FUSO|nr:hypothetical protein [Cetobacterium ceti]SJZ69016.1 hypothetical protein SAMN02745174_01271 [Cetobacterium ceti]
MKIIKIIKNYQARLFPILDVSLNGVNYFAHIFSSWYLTKSIYGNLNALLSFLSILIVTGISFQTLVAKEVSRKSFFSENILNLSLKYFLFILTLILIFHNKIILFFQSNFINLFLIFLIFTFNLFLSIFRGIIQGKENFLLLNINFYIEVLSKIFFMIILLPKFQNETSVLVSISLGMFLSLLHGYFYQFKNISIKKENIFYGKECLFIYFSNFFIYYFTSIDMILVNFKLTEYSGIYAVVLRYSQIILFVTFSIITVFLPSLSKSANDFQIFRKKAIKYFLFLQIINFIIFLSYFSLLPHTIKYIFGEKYLLAGNYLYLGGLNYSLLTTAFYIVNLNIILKREKYLYILGLFGFLYTLIIYKFMSSLNNIYYLSISIYFFMTITLIFLLYKEGEAI